MPQRLESTALTDRLRALGHPPALPPVDRTMRLKWTSCRVAGGGTVARHGRLAQWPWLSAGAITCWSRARRLACTVLTCTVLGWLVASSIGSAQPVSLGNRGPLAVGVRTLSLQDPSRGRHLTVEVWYPSAQPDGPIRYGALLGHTQVQSRGRARRGARPASGHYPLILVSHGQPGSRYQLAGLAETLASHGFVVGALDHTGSTYGDVTDAAYLSSLVDRPEDLLFALDQVPRALPSADARRTGLVGYSYGGYSALNAAGVGLNAASFRAYCAQSRDAPPCFALPGFESLAVLRGASAIRPDPRIKALFLLSPYGAPWLGASLASLRLPLFAAVGDRDQTAPADREARVIVERTSGPDRFLLTLRGAGHNVFGVCPAEVNTREHCADPAWTQAQAQSVTGHFAVAFFGHYLQGNSAAGAPLGPTLPGLSPGLKSRLTLRVEHAP
jgi:predicted dienelactone hydrolase